MGILFIILNQIAHQVEGMIVRSYGKKHGSGGMFFNAIICLAAMIFFVITDKDGFWFPREIFLYGIISCLMFAAGFYSMYLALQWGSYAMSRLISNFSGIFAIGYGLIFLKESANMITYAAMILVLISVFLTNYSKKDPDKDKQFSVKWLICVLVSLVSNGFIAIISRMQQIRFENACDNEFMILSFGGAFAALMILGFILERDKFRGIIRYGTLYGLGAGIANGAANFLNLLTYLFIPISIVTPIRTGMGIVASFLISVILYKEKFTKQQWIGAVIGVAAIVLLTI